MLESNLYELIRREDVVIFAGAGFSYYAGYPLGEGLKKCFVDKLDPEDSTKLNLMLPLDRLSEDIVRLKQGSRDFINGVLEEVFTRTPSSLSDHLRLASIPHFKTILTTNYDTLFEQAYGQCARLILKDSEIPQWSADQVNILKIHGDLKEKDSIVLTSQDYSRFYTTNFSSPFWAAIIKEIATKTVLFLGYGYEDANVWAIFKHVYDFIGVNRKEAYFVGPDADELKLNFLASKGIHYLNHTGESFLNALIVNIKDNITADLEKKWVSADTFRKFTASHGLAIGLSDTGSGFGIKSIEANNGGLLRGDMKFTLDEKSDLLERYKTFVDSGSVAELIMDESELANFQLYFEGIKLWGDKELNSISIKKSPKTYPFVLSVASEGFEIDKLTAEVFTGRNEITIKAKIHTLNFELEVDLTTLNEGTSKWQINHDKVYRSVNEEIQVLQLLKYFFSQKELCIFFESGNKIVRTCPVYDEERVQDAEMRLGYFYGLKKVEQAFGIRFKDFSDINEESVHNLNIILKILKGEYFVREGEMEWAFDEISPETIDQFEKINNSELPLELKMNLPNNVLILHGHSLPVPGLLIKIPEPEISNLEAIRNGDKTLKISSKMREIFEYYNITPYPVKN